MKTLRKPTPSKSKEYELEFKFIKERQKLIKYINELTEKIEERIILLENQRQ